MHQTQGLPLSGCGSPCCLNTQKGAGPQSLCTGCSLYWTPFSPESHMTRSVQSRGRPFWTQTFSGWSGQSWSQVKSRGWEPRWDKGSSRDSGACPCPSPCPSCSSRPCPRRCTCSSLSPFWRPWTLGTCSCHTFSGKGSLAQPSTLPLTVTF